MELNSSVRKGFYFSFDALLALTIMAGSLVVVYHSSQTSYDSFKAESVEFDDTRVAGQDALRLASRETFSSYNGSFQDELVEKTVMREDDLNRTILDGISLLWAARNFTYAGEATERFFDTRVSEENEYRLEVEEAGSQKIIFKTSDLLDNPDSVSSISRLVSGHRIDQPSEGFQARARATEAEANETEVYSFPPMGGAREGGDLRIRRQIEIDDKDKVLKAPLHISVHYGCNEADFKQLWVNGQNIQSEADDWKHQLQMCESPKKGTAAYNVVDISEHLEDGTNTIRLIYSNQDYGAYVHPGMRLEVTLKDQKLTETDVQDWQISPFNDMIAEEQGNSQTGGFAMSTFELPEDAEFERANITLRAENIERVYEEHNAAPWWDGGDGWDDEHFDGTCYGDDVSDVMVYLNGEELHSSYAPSDGSVYLEFEGSEVDEKVRNGTNVVTAYFNSFADCTWGEDQTHIIGRYHDPQNYSRINYSYQTESGDLIFGEMEVTKTEEFGGSVENPKQREFEFKHELTGSNLHIAQLFSSRVNIDARPLGDTWERVFESGDLPRSVPSVMYVDPSFYESPGKNELKLEDENLDTKFAPESSLEKTVMLSNQVGYGGLFPNKSAAVDDAEKRLNDLMGEYAEATNIEDETLSTGNQPYLWGPAEVKLVVWRE